MNSDHNEFEALRKLIALKRYEQPPPGYFNRLPGRIAARLESGEGQPGFWEKVLAPFAFRPAFVYGFSLMALSALTCSMIYSVRSRTQESGQSASNNNWGTGTAEESLAGQFNTNQSLRMASWMENDNSSNPAPILPSSFDIGGHARPLHVSFAGSP